MNRKRIVVTSFLVLTYAFLAGVIVYAYSADFLVNLNVTGQIGVNVKWAVPEGRVGASGTNWDTVFFLAVHNPCSSAALETSDVTTTAVDCTHLNPILFSSISQGTYDVTIKTNQHLSRRLSNVLLGEGLNTLNFTMAINDTSTIGPIQLLAGDINGAGNSNTTMGDNVVNSVDLSDLLNDLDANDPTAHAYRANFNQDSVVNAVDLSLMINNLDKTGE